MTPPPPPAEKIETELKPCPFCGGTNVKLLPTRNDEWCVICPTVGGCCISTGQSPSKQVVIDAWNRRSSPVEPQGSVEDLVTAFGDANFACGEYTGDQESETYDQLSRDCDVAERKLRRAIAHLQQRAEVSAPNQPQAGHVASGVTEADRAALLLAASALRDGDACLDEAAAARLSALASSSERPLPRPQEAVAPASEGWRPIETVPMDTGILIAHHKTLRWRGPVHVAYSHSNYNGAPRITEDGRCGWVIDPPPTHWQPLPAAPSVVVKSEGIEGETK